MIDVEVRNLEATIKGLENLPANLRRSLDDVFLRIADIAQQEALRTVPVRTGRLRGSIRVEVRPGMAESKVIAGGATAPYAYFVEHGTRFFAGRGYMKTALERTKPLIYELLRGIIERARR